MQHAERLEEYQLVKEMAGLVDAKARLKDPSATDCSSHQPPVPPKERGAEDTQEHTVATLR